MARVLLIGADEKTDVFEEVYGLLEKFDPEAIALEVCLMIRNIGERFNFQMGSRRKLFGLLGGEYTVNVEVETHPQIMHPGTWWCIYGEQSTYTPFSEYSAGIAYAITKGKPFYFIDWSKKFPDMFFQFYNGKMLSFSVMDDLTYLEYPDEFWLNVRKEPNIPQGCVGARNLFQSQIINQLLGEEGYLREPRHSSIAQIGGNGHFYAGNVRKNGVSYNLTPGLELPNLIKADEVSVIDLYYQTQFSPWPKSKA